MSPAPHSEPDRAEFVQAVLDWLDEPTASAETIDDAFALLSDQRRRLLLRVMRTYDEELTLPDAAEEVAIRETGHGVTDIPAERVTEVYLSLYHDHLPRLVDAGLLVYDQERDLVAPDGI
ncbi:hypothetical protein C488_15842 [Natrinema pellirubrum DSM 15624]|uniref:DUF7344 domain-containing protein n=1 Tax=Natrinema pellirubrum (strain DSM 15624 / CIP 106293 / JCM 10476 / NCIMB 786 / 157) TaxID=797303 RepID=L0JRP4_NATP1|nr:hypothetical protein [Natrinema pellirubrum]AGB33056.1 hypothetical protein Natpe_3267 [Natrinema pellirubrum DSM 15624]ELY71936.1 hypothetical protein C488_15842 [Natrinema pellirubrum DSM 15624]